MTRVHCPACAKKMTVALVVPRLSEPASDRVTYLCTDCTVEISRTESRAPVVAGRSGL
jgi:hypothetical protein